MQNAKEWAKAGVNIPKYSYGAMRSKTLQAPKWLHFGAGNIFRGYVARLQHELLNAGKVESGIILAESFDFEINEKILDPHNNLALLITLQNDGNMKKEIIASMAVNYRTDRHIFELENHFANPSLQMVSFTITEKGYNLYDLSGNFLPVVETDIHGEPSHAKHLISIVSNLMLKRFKAGAFPISLVSMDNCSRNGDKLRDAIVTVAKKWQERGKCSMKFIEYLQDAKDVAFPWTMIDKITPAPSNDVYKHLKDLGICGISPITTNKGTNIAAFVNAEEPEYLVIEDAFPNGRPPLEDFGVIFCDKDTVDKAETMKVATCLNPLHTAMAPFGCLLGYKSISSMMDDNDIVKLLHKIGYDEGMKVVVNPQIIDPKNFLDEVINVRFKNPYIPDTPERITTDTSQMVGIRFGNTIKAYMASETLDSHSLVGIPLAIAGWLRYLLRVDDNLEPIKLSPDPLHESLLPMLANIIVGKPETMTNALNAILANEIIFGVNLYDAEVGEKTEKYFYEMLTGKGAVRRTLNKTLA